MGQSKKMYEILAWLYDGQDVSDEFIGRYTKEEKDLFVQRLRELKYTEKEPETRYRDCDVTDNEVCEGCPYHIEKNREKKEYWITFQELKSFRYYVVGYSIVEVIKPKSMPIKDAIDSIIDPEKWNK